VRPLILLLVLMGCLGCGSSEGTTGAAGHGGAAGIAGDGGPSGTAGHGDAGAMVGRGGATGTAGTGGVAAVGPRVSDFLGVNGFIDDPTEKLAAVGNVREYHNWSWNDGNGATGYPGYPNNQLSFSLFSGFWDFDAYYAALEQAGAMVFPCVEGSVDYLGNAMPPVPAAADVTAPASYVAHASFMYQLAARYGTQAVPDANLKLASDQTVKTGTRLLAYYENGNEPDANWVHSDGSYLFSPEATAAMSSADYDGDQKRLGATFGVKNADPTAKMVLAGLAGAGPSADWLTNVTTYLDGMRSWAAAHRGGSFPADVINVHDYCFGPDPFGTANPRPGLPPESCGLRAALAGVVAYRDQHLPGKELWLTEFGYDTDPGSRLRAPAIGGADAQTVQGQWLVRSFLVLMEAGIDRAFLFVSRDNCTGNATQCPGNTTQFATSGVLTQKGDEQPKTAWYFLATLRARLGSMRYGGTASSDRADVSIARFFDAAANKGAYVVWKTTSDGSSVAGFALPVAASVSSATVVTLTAGSATGTAAAASIAAGHLTLTVTETPALVLVDGAP
jgi:hypothetical protein